ncbi:hypothetical protein HDU76_012344 [Blyttiomyces sp. JEL0837]|nr:hypothetical protein HDU76_012344 [Blyttiomyces sp. JEL0837]
MITSTTTSTTSTTIHPGCWGVLIYRPIDIETTDNKKTQMTAVSLTADAHIIDTTAKVTINQVFTRPNYSATTTTTTEDKEKDKDKPVEAVYKFPLPENAAVYKFECEVDGKLIVGIAKEKEEARKEYNEAIAAKKIASLLEQDKPDVFQVSVGNIKGQTVTTRISYIQELQHNGDSKDEIRFSLLSKHLRERYGDPPVTHTAGSNVATTSTASTIASTKNEPSVKIVVEMAGQIQSIQSPSHSSVSVNIGSVDVKENDDGDDNFDSTKAVVLLDRDDGEYLSKEMVVVVKAKGLDQPRCMIEKHPVDGTHAMSLTLVPRFALNEIRTEIIILVDRSGSMEGYKIEQAKKALKLLLKSLPTDSYFNIVGFGSSYTTLFPSSKEYDANSLATAESHVESIGADLGGTEIQSAIEHVLDNRRTDMSSQVFVLTDGEVWNSEVLFESIKNRVRTVKEKYGKEGLFVRVFSLGIGNDVSHDLVEGMARVGGGFAQFVVENEKLQGKVIRMLKGAVLPPVVDYKVRWTGLEEDDGLVASSADDHGFEVVEKEKKKISLFGNLLKTIEEKKEIVVKDFKRLVQPAPFEVPVLWPGVRFTAYAILDSSIAVPSTIKITGTSPDGPLELEIPVKHTSTTGTQIHTLAARKLIRDLEDGTSYLQPYLKKTQNLVGPVPGKTVKEEIVKIGVKYSLASKFTSFIAVEKDVLKKEGTEKLVVPEPASPPPPPQVQQEHTRLGGMNLMSSFASRMKAGPVMMKKMAVGGGGGFGGAQQQQEENQDEESDEDMGFGLFDGSAPAPPPPPPSAPLAKPMTMTSSSFSFIAAPAVSRPAPPPAPIMAFGAPMASAFGAAASTPGAAMSYDANVAYDSAPDPSLRFMDTRADFQPKKKVEKKVDVNKDLSDDELLHWIIDAQRFDGGFDLGKVCLLVKKGGVDGEVLLKKFEGVVGISGLSDDDRRVVVGTVLAVCVLEGRLKDLVDEWEMVAEKGKKFVVKKVGGGGQGVWEELVRVGKEVVGGL